MIKKDNNDTWIHFGDSRYSDYTKHKDANRRKLYILRHRVNQDWTRSGMNTAGFWSYWLLWNKPNLKEAIKKVESMFKIDIQLELG